MNKISCFLPYAGKEQVEKTVNSLQATGLIEEIRLITTDATLESLPDCEILFVDMPYSSATLKAIANAAKGEYTLLYTKETTLEMGMFALERMIHILEDSSAGMVYADHYQIADGKQSNAPVIDYQFGSLRDDFNFGSLLLFNTEKLKEAAGHMKSDYNFAGLYDLRLKLSQHSDLVHINEYLYSEVENDTRKSGEKIFDYVDPKNRDRQIEMEQACTEHLKEIGGYLAPEFKKIEFSAGNFEYEASVIIPVRNRIRTIRDAIKSVLMQKTDFKYNLIIIDNHSTDGTTEAIDEFKDDERVIHIIPERTDLGIGGCWNMGVHHPTGVDNRMRSTIDILHEAPNVNLVALYGPEHGVRGDVHAGDHVTDIKDATTGLPVYSLYGKTRKATPDMLKDVDVLVYDIQDIGCRSFTYISTMGLAMEAAAENGKEFIVLDRPNPVGGLKIEGNLVEDDCISFVSQFKIPYLYALTCGELALMLNGEKMLKDGEQCNLHIVKMKGWKRKMDYTQTGLQWVPSSPHIPHPHSAFFYPVSGILGELGYMSIGVGYTIPFQMFAAPWMEAEKLAGNLNRLNVPGVIFRPMYLKPFYSVGKGELLQGVQVHIMDFGKAPLSDLQFLVMQEVAALYPDRAVFDHADKGRFNMFDKVSGSRQIRERFSKRNRWEDIRDYWYKDAEDFRKLSKKYYLYK